MTINSTARIVDTVAHVRSQNGNESPHVVANGYYARGDKMPALYVYDPSDSTSEDNGGTVIVSEQGHRYKLNYSGSVSIDDFGAVGDGVTDDMLAIQAAFDWSSATKTPLSASAKTYGLGVTQQIAVEGNPSAWTAIILKTGAALHGAGMGKTVFKLLDGESSSAAPKWFNIITANTVIQNFQLSGMTFDINGQNNKIDSPADPLPGYTCAALMVTGSVASGGVDARLIDSVIDQVEVKNNPGVTNIGIGSRYGHPGTMGFNVTISRCKFYNSGIDSKDHSSIFGFGDGVTVIDCVFDHPGFSTGIRGPIVAVELHGNQNKMLGCTVRNYLQMAWISSGEDGGRLQTTIADNHAIVSYMGIGLFQNNVSKDQVSDIDLHGNVIRITGDVIEHPNLKSTRHGLYLGCSYGGSVNRLKVQGNMFYCLDRSNNRGAYIGADNSYGSTYIRDVIFSNNGFFSFSEGILVGAGSGSVLSVALKNNFLKDFPVTSVLPVATRGIAVRGLSGFSINISGNVIGSGDVGVPPQVGIELNGSMTSLFMDGNDVGDSQIGVADSMGVSGRRSGVQALTFASLPSQSTWKIGDVVYLRPAPELGPVGAKYVVDGWNRMTAGTANALNTDWVERRMLTGR